jgi:hypothetical protein
MPWQDTSVKAPQYAPRSLLMSARPSLLDWHTSCSLGSLRERTFELPGASPLTTSRRCYTTMYDPLSPRHDSIFIHLLNGYQNIWSLVRLLGLPLYNTCTSNFNCNFYCIIISNLSTKNIKDLHPYWTSYHCFSFFQFPFIDLKFAYYMLGLGKLIVTK